MQLVMKKDDKGQELTKNDGNLPTRRGFLFSLLGGFAGAAALFSIVVRAKTSSRAIAGEEPVPGRPVAKPIDNIFVPLSPKNDLKRRGQ